VLGREPAGATERLRRAASPAGDAYFDTWPLVPCHPWQAGYLLDRTEVKDALAAGQLKYLGARGPAFRPTASVRTLFNERCPYFLKVSLSLRITNSVRKNAWYELESAVALSRLLEPVADDLARRYAGFTLLPEPAAVTVDLPHLETEARRDLQSQFGVILRDNPFYQSDRHAVLAGSVFADDTHERSNAGELIERFRRRHPGMDATAAAVQWFEGYVQHLLPPVLHAFFEHGVAFEPHLQNVLIELDGHAVSGVILRDMEGTKLDRSRWPEAALPAMSDKARSSVRHARQAAWRRVVYCLFVNNLCQAVFHCGRGPVSEAPLWAAVRRTLEAYIKADDGALCRELAGPLLAGAERSAEDARVYSPVSRLFWNEAYLHVESPPGLEESEEARRIPEAAGARELALIHS
jgi:siderophore synthetase component